MMNASTGHHPTPTTGAPSAIASAGASGKSTLLNTPANLARPSAGQVPANQHDPQNPSNQALAQYRRHNVGLAWPPAAALYDLWLTRLTSKLQLQQVLRMG